MNSDRRSSYEAGQLTVLTVGFLVILGLLVVVVINTSAVFLQRQELASLADRVTLHAADGLDTESIYRDGLGTDIRLDASEASALTNGLVDASATMSLSIAQDTVTVSLERTIPLAIAPPGWPKSTVVVAESTGQLRLRP